MGIILNATQGAGAPQIEGGVYDAWFADLSQKSHPDWAGPGKFGPDDGERYHFDFLLSDPESPTEPLYQDGDPVMLDKLTNLNLNITSKTVPQAVKVLKALLTAAEFAAWEAGTAPNSDDLIGRPCQLVVGLNKNGYATIEDVLPGRKGFKARAAKAA